MAGTDRFKNLIRSQEDRDPVFMEREKLIKDQGRDALREAESLVIAGKYDELERRGWVQYINETVI